MAATWVFVALSALSLLLFVYPCIIYPQLLRLFSPKSIDRKQTDLTVSLLFCAYNEIECLAKKIENLRQLRRNRPDLQILVYDDSSSDGTYEILTGAADVLTAIRGPGRTGKAAGMKTLVQKATGDILIFTDANILLSADLIDRLLPYYGDPDVGGAACTIRTTGDPDSVTGRVGSAYVALDDKLQQLESSTGNVMGASGGLFSVRRELYPDFPDSVQDDFAVSMSVLFQGKRLVKAPDVVGFERSVGHRNEELRRKVRIGARAYHTHAFLRPGLRRMQPRDRMKYLSRKMLRWFGGVFLTSSAIFALAAIATVSARAAILVLCGALVALIFSLRSKSRPLATAGELTLATYATLIGVLQGMRGRAMTIWPPAKSR